MYTYISAVSQYYEAQVYDMFVIRGNTAIFKCSVPSFVSDYVYVESWEATNGDKYYTPKTSDFGSNFRYLLFIVLISYECLFFFTSYFLIIAAIQFSIRHFIAHSNINNFLKV